MRRSTLATLLAGSALSAVLLAGPHRVLAQPVTAPAPTASAAPATGAPATGAAAAGAAASAAQPTLSIDLAQLPPLPPIVPAGQREQMALVATGAGAAVGVILADIVTGGLLLSPLGVPSAAALVGFGGGGAAIAAPTYSVAQRLLAGVASIAAAVGGGYIGGYLARSRPDLIGLQE